MILSRKQDENIRVVKIKKGYFRFILNINSARDLNKARRIFGGFLQEFYV